MRGASITADKILTGKGFDITTMRIMFALIYRRTAQVGSLASGDAVSKSLEKEK
jgi:hypothetical protein